MRYISKNFIDKEIKDVGFDESWLKIGVEKHKFLNLKINALRAIEANILKQTALSCGCDCAVHKRVIDCKIEYSDCILSGTISQLREVLKKLKRQPLNLPKISDEIAKQIIIFNNKTRTKPQIMGILNLSEDSFSDGGEFLNFEKACLQVEKLINEGAEIIDIGAQSTNSNSKEISETKEIERILPILKFLNEKYPKTTVSIDTRSSLVALKCLENSADIINDVSGLNFDKNMAKTVAKFSDAKIVITHSRGLPNTMNNFCNYKNLMDEIFAELKKNIDFALNSGIKKENIIIDPGFGFAKNDEQNIELLKRIEEFKSLGFPILVGVSRKKFLQNLIDTKNPKEADAITAMASFYFAQKGVNYIRVHDVLKTVQAVNFGYLLR